MTMRLNGLVAGTPIEARQVAEGWALYFRGVEISRHTRYLEAWTAAQRWAV